MNFQNVPRRTIGIAAAIVAGWAVSAWLLYSLTFANVGEFDPNQIWLGESASMSAESLGLERSDDIQVVHVRAPFCSCNPLADQHVAALPQNVQQHWRSADSLQAHGVTLPATPAVLIFQQNQLIYAGPYASGALCSVENSLIDDILTGKQQLAGTFYNGMVRTCRCLQ